MDLPLGRNTSTYDYKTACNAPAQLYNTIRSTVEPKVSVLQICPGQRAGQSHLRRYYDSAKAQCSSCSSSYYYSAKAHAVAALRVMYVCTHARMYTCTHARMLACMEATAPSSDCPRLVAPTPAMALEHELHQAEYRDFS